MTRTTATVLALLSLAAPAVSQTDGRGAKELFYDPAGANVESARPAATPAAPSSTSTPTHRPRSPEAVQRLGSGTRRPVSLPASSKAQTARKTLGLSYWIELVQEQGNAGVQVSNTRVFRSGERIRLHFLGNMDGHVALIQLGSSGTGQLLFPNPGKGLTDTQLTAGQERILPNDAAWFRFDDNPGTERLIVMFARSRDDLDSFPLRPSMDKDSTASVIQTAKDLRGSKDLLIETEAQAASEVGTYGVSLSGQPVILEIALQHR